MELKKSPQANIEKSRKGLILVGMVLALSFTLISLEWVLLDEKRTLIVEDNFNDMEDEIPELVIEQAQPEPPPPPPPAPADEIEVIDDEDEREETPPPPPPPADEPPPPPPPPKEKVIDDKIYEAVEEQPEFPGGTKALYKFLGKNMKYPQLAREAEIQGKVWIEFVVRKTGKVDKVKVLRGIGSGCDEEAMRVVKKMPNWSPGKQGGNAVSVKYRLPVVFKLN